MIPVHKRNEITFWHGHSSKVIFANVDFQTVFCWHFRVRILVVVYVMRFWQHDVKNQISWLSSRLDRPNWHDKNGLKPYLKNPETHGNTCILNIHHEVLCYMCDGFQMMHVAAVRSHNIDGSWCCRGCMFDGSISRSLRLRLKRLGPTFKPEWPLHFVRDFIAFFFDLVRNAILFGSGQILGA